MPRWVVKTLSRCGVGQVIFNRLGWDSNMVVRIGEGKVVVVVVLVYF